MAFGKNKAPKLSPQQQAQMNAQSQAQQIYRQGVVTLRDVIAPSSIQVEAGFIRIGSRFARTLFVYAYPRSLFTGWLSPIINKD